MPSRNELPLSYHDRRFRARQNSATGEVDATTLFHYRQRGDVVWATYCGGGVTWGTLVATVDAGGGLDMRYQHVSADGSLKTGVCHTRPELLPDGRLRLQETWRWTSGGEGAGTSVLEEISAEDEDLDDPGSGEGHP
jgi:hypothetical protein